MTVTSRVRCSTNWASQVPQALCFVLFFLLNFYLFILRESEHTWVGRGTGSIERIPRGSFAVSIEPHMGLEIRNPGEHDLSRNQESDAYLTEPPRGTRPCILKRRPPLSVQSTDWSRGTQLRRKLIQWFRRPGITLLVPLLATLQLYVVPEVQLSAHQILAFLVLK